MNSDDHPYALAVNAGVKGPFAGFDPSYGVGFRKPPPLIVVDTANPQNALMGILMLPLRDAHNLIGVSHFRSPALRSLINLPHCAYIGFMEQFRNGLTRAMVIRPRGSQMKLFLRACSIVLGIVNGILFVFWLSLIRVDALTTEKVALSYRFDLLTLEITAMGTIVAILGIVLVVLGFFGFQFLVERAEIQADKTARETATLVVKELHRDGRLIPGATTIPSNPKPTVQNVPLDDSQTEDV